MNPSKPRYASASSTPLAKALQDGAAQYLSANEAHRYANTGVFLKIAVLFAVVIALYWPTLKAVSPLQFILAYIGFIVMGMVLAMNSLHDAAHDAVFKSALWNQVLKRVVSIPVGIDAGYWTLRHVQYHHHYANVDGHDLDIEPNPVLRYSPFHAWAPHYRYQHLYWAIIAGISLPYLC